MNETPTPRPFRSIAEGIVRKCQQESWHGSNMVGPIEKALEALAAEKDGYCRQAHVEIGKLTESGWKLLREKDAELASLRSEVERLKQSDNLRWREAYMSRRSTLDRILDALEAEATAAKYPQDPGSSFDPVDFVEWLKAELSLALKERDALQSKASAYREVAIKMAGAGVWEGYRITKEAFAKSVDAEAQRLLSSATTKDAEGRKALDENT